MFSRKKRFHARITFSGQKTFSRQKKTHFGDIRIKILNTMWIMPQGWFLGSQAEHLMVLYALLEQCHIYFCVCDSQTQICDLWFVTFAFGLHILGHKKMLRVTKWSHNMSQLRIDKWCNFDSIPFSAGNGHHILDVIQQKIQLAEMELGSMLTGHDGAKWRQRGEQGL